MNKFLTSKSLSDIIAEEARSANLFTPLFEKSKEQPGYQYPINISEKLWQLMERKGGQRSIPTIHNNSSTTVFVKPEGRLKHGPGKVADHKTPIALPANGTIYGGIDGVNTWRHGHFVFKTVDGIKVQVTSNGEIKVTSYKNLYSLIGQWCIGGWKDKRNRSSWVALSETFETHNRV